MKTSQIKDAFNSVFEEDEALKYALATNIAKYGRPQSKPSDQPAKLTKGLEKKREKAVKDLKKVMDEDKGRDRAREFISKMRDAMRSFSDDELDTFRKDIAQALDLNVNEDLSENFDKVSGGIPYKVENGNAIISIPLPDDVIERIIKRAKENGYSASPNMAGGVTIRKKGFNEDKGTLNKIADMLSRKFDDLDFDVNTMSDRIDVRGSRSDLADFGEELQGKKIFDYEVFYIEEDPGERGAIVRIVRSDKIMREAKTDYDFSEEELIRVLRQLLRGASDERGMIQAFEKALGRKLTDDEIRGYKIDPSRISKGSMEEEQTMQGNPNLRMGTYAGRKVIVNTMGTEDMTKWKAVFLNTGKRVDFADVAANIKLDEKKKKKKKDRCHRKADQVYGAKTSAYKSGAIVKCRKGMIWKKRK